MTSRVRHQAGWGLIAYGSLGTVIILWSFLAVYGSASSLNGLPADRAAAIQWLDLSGQALDDAGRSSTNAATSLRTAAGAARSAASLASSLSASMAALRDASTQSVLGTRPFGGLTDDFDQVASQATSTAAEMTQLAADVDRNGGDFALLSADVTTLGGRLHSLRDAVSSLSADDLTSKMTAILVMVSLLLVWLAVPAAVALIVGIALVRSPGKSPSL